jgi:hypothetical protein
LGKAKSGALSFNFMISTRFWNKLHLYRRSRLQASVAVLVFCSALALVAAPFQHRNSHKLRAVALLELTTDASGTVTTRLVPITILDNQRFHDASIYEARPRPMALGAGIVYEAQKSGIPVGYVTISTDERLQGTWIGTGKWQPVSQVASKPKPPGPPASAATSGSDRPILHRPDENPPPPSTQGSSDDRPVLHRSDNSGGDQQTSTQPSSAPAETPDSETPDDPNRPVLRRRQPSTQETSTPSPSPSTAPQTPTAAAQGVPSAPLVLTTPGTQTFVAVSDAQTSDARSFEFKWKPEEQQQIEAKMRKLALAQLPGENAQANEHSMTNVVIRSFDVDMSNEAVVVLTAEIPGGYLARGTKAAPGKFVSRYICVIARTDVEGNPTKLAVSVTDSSQLDIAPRLELIDAVDVDGDGLAELLFREYGFDQKSFIVYGVGHGTVTKVFEGASQDLR